MNKKTKVTLSMDREVVESAKQIGLNISQFCENALKEAVKTLRESNLSSNSKKDFLSQGSLSKKVEWSLGRALIPRPPPYQGGAPPG